MLTDNQTKAIKRLTRSQAIRAKCIDCCCGQVPEVRKCAATNWPLWNYRLGKEVTQEINSESEKA